MTQTAGESPVKVRDPASTRTSGASTASMCSPEVATILTGHAGVVMPSDELSFPSFGGRATFFELLRQVFLFWLW
jgi:hypothetical protein